MEHRFRLALIVAITLADWAIRFAPAAPVFVYREPTSGLYSSNGGIVVSKHGVDDICKARP